MTTTTNFKMRCRTTCTISTPDPSPTDDFAAMTAEAALEALVDLDVQRWGEAEREASRKMHGGKSRGRLINSIVYHQVNEYGDLVDGAAKKIAANQLTAADRAGLRDGG